MSELETAKADNVRLAAERERLVQAVEEAQRHVQELQRAAAGNSELANSMLASSWMAVGGADIPQYDLEKKDIPFSQFRVDFEVHCAGMGLEEDNPARRMLLHKALKGLALQKFKDVLKDESLTSYADIMNEMEQYLNSLEGGVRYSSTSFHKRKQEEGETVTAYYADLMKLAKVSWPRADNPPPDQVLLEKFIRGLRLPIKRIVLAKEPDSLRGALEHACKAQAQREFLLEDEPLVAATAVTSDALTQKVDELSKQISNLVAYTAAPPPPNKVHWKGTQSQSPPFRAKSKWPERNHHFPTRDARPQPRKAYNSRGDQRCWNCSEFGHFSSSCRKPKRNWSNNRSRQGHGQMRNSVNSVSMADINQDESNRAGRSGTGGGVGFANGQIMLATLCFMSMMSVGFAQRPMLCKTTVPGQLFKLPEIYACQTNFSTPLVKPSRVTVELARRNLLQYETKGWLCKGIKSSARLLRYFFGDELLKEFTEEPISVSIDQCKRMINTNTSPAGELTSTSTGMRKTDNQLNWQTPRAGLPECCKWWEYDVTNFFVTPVSVYMHFGAKRFQCTGADVSGCTSYQEGSCQLGDKSLVWDVEDKVDCKYLPFKNLSGNQAEMSWMSTDGQLALTTHMQRNVTDCAITWTLSDQGIAFRQLYPDRVTRDTDIADGDVGYVMTDVLAAELQALHDTVRDEMHMLYRHSLQQTCNSLEVMSELLRAFTIASPTVAARQLLNRTNIVAVSTHEVLELWSCLTLRDVSFMDKPVTGDYEQKCIKEIPIVVKTHNISFEGFLEPDTLVVKRVGTPMPCETHPLVTFQMFNKVFTYHRPTFEVKRRSTKFGPTLPYSHLSVEDDFNDVVMPKVFKPVVMYTWQELQPIADLNALLHNTLVEQEVLDSLKFLTKPANYSNNRRSGHFKFAETLVGAGLANVLTFLKEPVHLWIALSCLGLNIYGLVVACRRLMRHSRIGSVFKKFRSRKVRRKSVPSPVDVLEVESFIDNEPIEHVVRRVCEGNASSVEVELANHLVSAEKVLTLGVIINGRTFSFLLDSGASVSLVTEQLVNELNIPGACDDSDSGLDAVSVTGHKLPIKGTIELNVQIGTKCRTHPFRVLRNCCLKIDGILGLDILAKLPPFTVDVQSKQVYIGKEQLPVSGAADLVVSACVASTVRLAPRTARVIPCKLSIPVKTGANLIFEQNPNSSLEVLCPHTLVSAGQTIPVRVTNVHQHPTTVYSGTKLGVVSFASAVQTSTKVGSSKRQISSKPEVLQNLYLENSNITWEEEDKLKELLQKYCELFANEDSDLPGTSVCEHEIHVTNEHPIKQKPYRVPESKRKEVDEKIDALLEANVISPSSSPWASPVVLVSKPDGSIRICIDYRKLNAVTVPDAYPLPHVDEAMGFLSGAKYLTTLDLFSGFHQVPVAEDSKKYTAFITSRGLFQWNRLPFGLRNSPATFQRLMAFVLSGLLFSSAIVYLDDVLIASKTFEEHLKHLEEVFNRLLQFGLRLKMKKCHWVRRSLPFLGFVITPEGTYPNPANTDKLLSYSPPTNVSQLRTFLGMCNFYRRFVPNYADIVRPLTNLTKRINKKFDWSKDCEVAFQTLISKLTKAPILRYPQFDRTFIVSVDASKYACGGVLSQMYGDREHPIAYFSRLFQKHEVNYETVEKELYAVVLALKHWKHYLFGHPIHVYSDQQSISWGIKQASQTRLMKWVSQMAEYDVKIFYRPGSKNRPADFFSRMNYTSVDLEEEPPMLATRPVVSSIVSLGLDTQRDFFRAEQRKDPVLRYVIDRKLNNTPVSQMPEALRSEVVRLDRKSVYGREDGCLRNFSDSCGRVIVPCHLKSRILEECHDTVYGGHFKVEKTLSKVLEKFYWPTVRQDVENWVKSCEGCLTRAHMTHPSKEPMQPICAAAPWNSVVMDLLGPLPRTNRGNKYILVIMDRFTKYPECMALRSISAKVVANAFVNLVVCRHGVPLQVQTDRGTQFTSKMFAEVSKVLGMKQNFSTAYHPQSQGLVEKFNGTLLQILKGYVNRDQTDWCHYLNLALFAFRTSKQSSTGVSPFELEHGRVARLPIHLLCPTTEDTEYHSTDEYASLLVERIRKCWELAYENNQLASGVQKRAHDKKVHSSSVHPGDKVYVKRPTPRVGLSPKLQPLYKGPYQVLVKQGVDVFVQKNGAQKPQWVHLNDCKPSQERDTLWPEALHTTEQPAGNLGDTDTTPGDLSDMPPLVPIDDPSNELDVDPADAGEIIWDDVEVEIEEEVDTPPRRVLRPRDGPKPIYNFKGMF